MKFQIIAFQAPQALVRYSTDDGLLTEDLWVRIDPKEDGTIPAGQELTDYIMLFAPVLPKPEPYAGVDWSAVQQLVTPLPTASVSPTMSRFVEVHE